MRTICPLAFSDNRLRQAEAAQRASELKFAQFAQATPDALWIYEFRFALSIVCEELFHHLGNARKPKPGIAQRILRVDAEKVLKGRADMFEPVGGGQLAKDSVRRWTLRNFRNTTTAKTKNSPTSGTRRLGGSGWDCPAPSV